VQPALVIEREMAARVAGEDESVQVLKLTATVGPANRVVTRIREAHDFDILSSYPKSWRPDTCECTNGSRDAVRYRKDFQMTRSNFRRFRSQCQLVLALIVLFAFVPFAQSAAQSAGVQPILALGPVTDLDTPGSIRVTGSGFTAGGDVFIGLYDQWGKQLYEPRWVAAGAGSAGEGDFSESFDIACRSGVMVRAHDRTTGIWTDVLDIDILESGCVDPRDDRRTPD
jgi:hypothetical protein